MEPNGGGKESKEVTPSNGNVKVKEEPREEPPPAPKAPEGDQAALSDFAETTMNELLGWYGYDKVVDREDTQGLNLQRFTSRSSPDSAASPGEPEADVPSNRDSASNGSCESDVRAGSAPSPGSGSEIAAHHQNLVSALTTSKSPTSPNSSNVTTNSSVPSGYILCAWCQKPGLKLFTLKTETVTKVFCSELCFTQCRRASFKKNKVCDWCKHVRHTVNYVDFQDGEQQLQFCSDKCLNQYKMNIFCKETQEHLQLIHNPQSSSETSPPPHATAAASHSNTATSGSGDKNNQILITPELWMQNGDGLIKGGGQESRKRKASVTSDTLDDEDDLSSNCPTPVEPITIDKKPDITKMNVKGEGANREHVRTTERHIPPSTPETPRRMAKVDNMVRDRTRRLRSRDSTCTPLSVTTSPGSSQMSTPPSVTTAVTPPSMGAPPLQAFPGGMMGGVPPGFMAPPHYFYPHLMAGGFPGLPPGAWMVPPPPGVPLHPPPPPGVQTQLESQRHSVVRPAPNAESAANTSRTDTAPNRPVSPGNPASVQAAPGKPPGVEMPPGFPYPIGMMPGGIPPHLPFPPPPGFPPGIIPPPPNLPGGPPVTVMVPYPLICPIPVPIPIPVPVRNDKDLQDLATIMNPSSKPTRSTSAPIAATRSASVPIKVPSSGGTTCSSQRQKCLQDEEKENSESAANCEAINREKRDRIACACCQKSDHVIARPDIHAQSTITSDSSCKVFNGLPTLDTDPRAPSRSSLKHSDPELPIRGGTPNGIEEVAIDLTKDKTKCEASPMVLGSGLGVNSLVGVSTSGSAVPQLPAATITVKSECNPQPLIISPLTPVGGFLMPPRDHAYSSRRSMILDAPSVPRDRNKSPSPEKRLMLRSPNRDVMFAKRRCMRTRIKTK